MCVMTAVNVHNQEFQPGYKCNKLCVLQDNVTVMIEEVKEAFKSRLADKEWLDDTTRERCAEKVDAITAMVAYPDQIDNDTFLNELYAVVSPPAYL